MLPKSTLPLLNGKKKADANGATRAGGATKLGVGSATGLDEPSELVSISDATSKAPSEQEQASSKTEPPLDSSRLVGTGARIVLECGGKVWAHAQARLPTSFGDFEVVAFRDSRDEHEHIALVRGRPSPADIVPVRVHSECLTGDVLSSLRCDCQAQLHAAQSALGRSHLGVLLYMRQEGRGIGLANKISAYALQDDGLDTVEANLHLGFDDDLRTYDVAAAILRLLAIEKVSLYTNNPRKVFGLRGQGIEVSEIYPIRVGATNENIGYLATKRDKSGHLL